MIILGMLVYSKNYTFARMIDQFSSHDHPIGDPWPWPSQIGVDRTAPAAKG